MTELHKSSVDQSWVTLYLGWYPGGYTSNGKSPSQQCHPIHPRMNCTHLQAAWCCICSQIPRSTMDISQLLFFTPYSRGGVCLIHLFFSEATSICRCSCASVFNAFSFLFCLCVSEPHTFDDKRLLIRHSPANKRCIFDNHAKYQSRY